MATPFSVEFSLILIVRGKPPFAAISRKSFDNRFTLIIHCKYHAVFQFSIRYINNYLIPVVKIGFHALALH